MATADPVSDTVATPSHPEGPSQIRYTGVVVIHGLGMIKRNTTLEEAVNALAYWFNKRAHFALRREGPGRVWVGAQLTDDPNPDAPAASASLHLAAPRAPAPSSGDDTSLRLEFREVWWAESFGVPSVGATIAWTRVQAWEQATRLLIPIGRGQTAAQEDPGEASTGTGGDEGDAGGAHTPLGDLRRLLLRGDSECTALSSTSGRRCNG